MPRSPHRTEGRIRRIAPVLALALGLPLAAHAQDAAYVDSPTGRRVADPARADGGSVAPGTVFVRPGTGGPGAMNSITQMQMQMLAASIASNQRLSAAEQAATAGAGDAGEGNSTSQGGGAFGAGMPMGAMPQGGIPSSGTAMPGGMGSGMQPAPPTGYAQTQQTPMQQIGAGMVQDAGNLMDAGIRRSVYGDDAAIMVPSPGTATVDGGGW